MRVPLNIKMDQAKAVEATRSCGPCTACCVLPRIEVNEKALPLLFEGKPGYKPCKHLVTTTQDGCSGCSRYDERPPTCSEFACMWREGFIEGDERRRPDQLGLMFVTQLNTEKSGLYVDVWELWEGAASNHPGRWIVEAFASKYKVSIRYYGVPCSLVYKDARSFMLGNDLSKLAQQNPKELGAILREFTNSGRLKMPMGTAELDLQALECGEAVEPHFRSPTV